MLQVVAVKTEPKLEPGEGQAGQYSLADLDGITDLLPIQTGARVPCTCAGGTSDTLQLGFLESFPDSDFIINYCWAYNILKRSFQQRVSYSSGFRLRTKECFFCSPTVVCIERTEAALCLDFKVDAVEALNDLDFWDKSAARPGQLELGARWAAAAQPHSQAGNNPSRIFLVSVC